MNIFQSITNDLKKEFSTGTTVTRLIIINAIVFVLLNIIYIFTNNFSPFVFQTVIEYLALPIQPTELIYKPWTLVTHFFLHSGFWHLLWNMLFLYWFGRIVGDLVGDHRILPLYVLGGLTGAIFFILSGLLFANINPESYALGASGAAMAIVVASAVIAPEYELQLLLIGRVKLKYVVAVLVFLDLIQSAGNTNSGGAIAHLGGAAMGWLYFYALQNGVDLGSWVVTIEKWIRNNTLTPSYSTTPFTVVHRSEEGPNTTHQKNKKRQMEVDEILEKIKKSGYESLSKEEKEILFQASKDS